MSHPIAPPPELVQQWINEADGGHDPRWQEYEQDIATRAAQWGADQELEACCLWVNSVDDDDCFGANLRAARRPKPPSLKEQAMEDLASIEANCGHLTRPETLLQSKRAATIRRALEQLND
jgi:hypothetical protein